MSLRAMHAIKSMVCIEILFSFVLVCIVISAFWSREHQGAQDTDQTVSSAVFCVCCACLPTVDTLLY